MEIIKLLLFSEAFWTAFFMFGVLMAFGTNHILKIMSNNNKKKRIK